MNQTFAIVRNPTGIPCNLIQFGVDPLPGNIKECHYLPLNTDSASSTTGQWTKIASCHANKCALNKTLVTGTTKTNSWANTNSWSNTVKVSITAGAEIFSVASVDVSTEYAHEWAESETYTNALTRSMEQRVSAECTNGGGGTLAMWQFETNTETPCLENGVCTGKTIVSDYVCSENTPPNYSGPKCLPGACANAHCDVCTY